MEVAVERKPPEPNRETEFLAQVNEDLKYFWKYKQLARFLFRFFQSVSIILGAATPVLILLQPPVTPWVQAVVAAAGALAVTAMTTFKWREEWAQCASAHQLLTDELIAYKAGVGRYAGPDAIAHFIARRKVICEANFEEWRQTLLQPPNSDDAAPK